MYNPAFFAETRPDVLHAFIRAHPLGTLVTSGADGTLGFWLGDGERVAGFVHLGTTAETPLERVRPDVSAVVSEWNG